MKTCQIHSSEVYSKIRFDAWYHLSDAVFFEKLITQKAHDSLGNLTERIFTAGRSKRIYTSSDYGYPYLSNSDVVSLNPINTCSYVSRKYSRDDNSFLKEGMIVTGRVGAIGQTSYISNELEEKEAMGSDNIIRIVPNSKILPGYLYSFLVSKYGNTFFWKIASGGVQPYISEPALAHIPIPIIDKIRQNEIHGMIKEAGELRKDANRLSIESENLFDKLNGLIYPSELLDISENKIKIGYLIECTSRFKTTIKAKNYSYRVSKIIDLWNSKKGISLDNYIIEPLRLGQKSSIKRINDSHFKGVDFVSQLDLHKANPKEFKKVKVIKLSDDDLGKENLVLFPAVGNASGEGEIFVRPVLAYKTFLNKLLSGDIGKLNCKTLEDAAYLYTALKSKAGFRIMRAMVYGTQLRRPTWELLKHINIPLASIEIKELIATNIIEAQNKYFKAQTLENKAISLIEKEIESWQN